MRVCLTLKMLINEWHFVLDEVLVRGCNDDGVVKLVRERLFVVQTMVTPYAHFFLWRST